MDDSIDDITHEIVEIDCPNPFLLTDFSIEDPKRQLCLRCEYYRPATTRGPYPGVVVSEGLGGVKTSRERRYGRFLAQHGCAALVIDSFATRGYGDSPHPIRAINVTESMMLADAFAGLVWLAGQDDVDAGRIFNIGFSYGGMISILTAYEQLRRHFVKGGEAFAGHVSYYGPTVPRLEDWTTTGAPIAILNGELDANCNFDRLERIAGDLRKGGSPVDNIVFAGGYHQWDSDDIERRFDQFNLYRGATLVAPDNAIFDENTNLKVAGFSSRLLMLMRAVSLDGFYLQRDPELMRRSDEVLLRYVKDRSSVALPA